MTMLASKFIVVEDDYDDVTSMVIQHKQIEKKVGEHQRGSLPPLRAKTARQARRDIVESETHGDPDWDGTECLLLDCWDWGSVADRSDPSQSGFFVLDLLLALRKRKETGLPTPTVVAYSAAMGDPLLRAALGEFTAPVRRVPCTQRNLTWALRLDHERCGPRGGGVLAAMFERATVGQELHRIALGDMSGSLKSPAADSALWDDFLPGSCLASFHQKLRDVCPEAWETHVLNPNPPTRGNLPEKTRTRINRIGLQYIEPDPERGPLDYAGYLEIARRLANPTPGTRRH